MKKVIASIVLALFAVSSFAISISSARGSSSARSIGFSRPSIAPPRPAAPAIPPVRTNTYTPPPAPATRAAPPAAAPVQNSGPTNTSTFLSSMGGSVVGSMIGNSINGGGHSTVVAPGGMAAAAAPGQSYAAPVVVQQSSSLAGTVWSILGALAGAVLICLIGIAAYQFWRSWRGQGAIQNGDLPFGPIGIFDSIQRAFWGRNEELLRSLVDRDIVNLLIDDLPEVAVTPRIFGISFTVLDVQRKLVSIHYQADDMNAPEGKTRIDEIWHFKKFGEKWKLAGIDRQN